MTPFWNVVGFRIKRIFALRRCSRPGPLPRRAFAYQTLRVFLSLTNPTVATHKTSHSNNVSGNQKSSILKILDSTFRACLCCVSGKQCLSFFKGGCHEMESMRTRERGSDNLSISTEQYQSNDSMTWQYRLPSGSAPGLRGKRSDSR